MNVKRPDTLVQCTVQTLRAAIAEGAIGSILPGEPRLSTQLGVSRRTLRKALDVLTHEGSISASTRGKPRKLLLQLPPSKSAQRVRTVGVLLEQPLDSLWV